MARRALLVLVAAVLLLTGCSREAENPAPSPTAQKWTVKGTLVSVNPGEQQVTINHQEIPGLMAGMTMAFRVADSKLLDGFSAGDTVEFEVMQTEAGLLVTALRKVDAEKLKDTPPTAYHGKGMVVLVNRKLGAVLLRHEGAGPLPAGELVLPVRPPEQLDGFQDDTPVEFTLAMMNDQLVVTELKKLSKPPTQ